MNPLPDLQKISMPTFLSYTPVPLAFGTSGLRGLVKDITDLEAYINVKGAIRYLLSIGDISAGSGIVLAGDLRPSTDRLMKASLRAITDSGCRVENAGKIPTPALVSHAVSTGRAGVMVSGSHIPFDRNGIKINKSIGEVLKADEPGILREVERVRAEEYSRTATTSAFNASRNAQETFRSCHRSTAARKKATYAAISLASPRMASRAGAFLSISTRRSAATSWFVFCASLARM